MSNKKKSTRQIELTQGQVALIDAEDYEKVSQYKWHAAWGERTRSYYAAHSEWVKGSGRPRTIRMHRVILDAPDGLMVDHVNHNTLDNRKENLRLCDQAANSANARQRRDSTAPYKGIEQDRTTGRWYAHIKVHGKRIYLGVFDEPVEAARAYDQAARVHFGEYAYTNDV